MPTDAKAKYEQIAERWGPRHSVKALQDFLDDVGELVELVRAESSERTRALTSSAIDQEEDSK